MHSNRRGLLTTVLASAALGATGLGAAGCGGRVNRRPVDTGLDSHRLAEGFGRLAQRTRPGVFDLGVMTLDRAAVWCADDNSRYPMQDLFMLPLAAAALAEVDAGRMKLNEPVRIGVLDLSPPPSRLNRAFPAGAGPDDHIDVPAADLIALAVQESDNTAADVLMRRIGGPGAVTAWLEAHGVKDMRVDRYAREVLPGMIGLESFRAAWKDPGAWAEARSAVPPGIREAKTQAYLLDPRDTTTAQAAMNILNQLSIGALLSRGSTALLLRLMTANVAGPARLRAGLPSGARLAHKTGSSITDLGITPVTHDIGLVTLPNGRRFAIAALLAGSTGAAAQRDGAIADAARLAVSALG